MDFHSLATRVLSTLNSVTHAVVAAMQLLLHGRSIATPIQLEAGCDQNGLDWTNGLEVRQETEHLFGHENKCFKSLPV